MEDDEGRGGQADEGETCGVEMVSLCLLAGGGGHQVVRHDGSFYSLGFIGSN